VSLIIPTSTSKIEDVVNVLAGIKYSLYTLPLLEIKLLPIPSAATKIEAGEVGNTYEAVKAYEALVTLPNNNEAVAAYDDVVAYEALTTPPNNTEAVAAYDDVVDKEAVPNNEPVNPPVLVTLPVMV
jgi:hypothetical protein